MENWLLDEASVLQLGRHKMFAESLAAEMEKPQPIAHAAIATKAKGSLIDETRLCSFGFHTATTK
jgi:hypothetical protein